MMLHLLFDLRQNTSVADGCDWVLSVPETLRLGYIKYGFDPLGKPFGRFVLFRPDGQQDL
jgi:hypothetical protein